MAKRRIFSADFKAKIALSAIRGDGTMAQLASRLQYSPEHGGEVETPGAGRDEGGLGAQRTESG
jgi:hypothetical protein